MDLPELKQILNKDYVGARKRWRNRNAYYYKDILRLLQFTIPAGGSILECGLDESWLLSTLKPQRGVFLSMSPAGMDNAERSPEHRFFEDTELNSLPFSETFDYIVLPNTVGSVPHLLPYLKRLLSASHARSRLVITYYNHLWEPWIRLAQHLGLKQKQPIQNWLSLHDLQNFLELAGFEVLKQGHRLLLPINIPILSWFLNRILARLPILNRLGFWNYVIARPHPHHFKSRDYTVSVVVPARNERGNIADIVKRTPQMGRGTEIIFVEGGSSDGTWEEIKRVAEEWKDKRKIIITKQTGRGKGDAVRRGFEHSSGEILMILDADLTVPPEDLPAFYEAVASRHADYVHGSRLVYPLEEGSMKFLNMIANKFFGMSFSWLLKQRIKDTLCGTKVITRRDYDRLQANRNYFGEFDPFGDFDLIFGASKLALKMAEIPVRYRQRTYGSTNISRFRHGWILLKMLLFAARKLE